MADANTSIYKLIKPEVGASADTWGSKLNSDLDYVDAVLGAKATTGSANAYVLTTSLSLSAYATGQSFLIIPNFTNTGAATINVDGLGAKAITKVGANALDSGDLVSGQVFRLVYDGTQFQIVDGVTNALDTYNAIINGDFEIAQRGASFTSATTPANSDDTYLLDRWTLLSDGNDIVDVTQDTTTVPTGKRAAIALDVETANKKFGIIQFIEQRDAVKLIGGNATLSFQAKVSSVTKLDNLKAAIISWDGTADTLTSDVVSAWGVEGTNPTLVANWTYENSPVNLNPTTSYQTFSITAAIDTASAKNIAVFIWSDVTDTTLGDFLYITGVRLVAGSVAKPLVQRPYEVEVRLCERYYEKTFPLATTPADNTGVGGTLSSKTYAASTEPVAMWKFKTRKRASPTVIGYSPQGGTAGQWRNFGNSVSSANANVIDTSESGCVFANSNVGIGAAGDLYQIHATAAAEL